MLVHENSQFTYAQMMELILKTADFIDSMDFKIGGIFLPNSPQFITYLFALNKQNKLVVPLSYQLKGESLCERINYADMEALFVAVHEILNLLSQYNDRSYSVWDHIPKQIETEMSLMFENLERGERARLDEIDRQFADAI